MGLFVLDKFELKEDTYGMITGILMKMTRIRLF